MRSGPQGEFSLHLEELEEWIKTAKYKDQVINFGERMMKAKQAWNGPSSCIEGQSVCCSVFSK